MNHHVLIFVHRLFDTRLIFKSTMGKKKSVPVKKVSQTAYAGKAFEKVPDEEPVSAGGGGIGIFHLLIAVGILAAGIALAPKYLNKETKGAGGDGVASPAAAGRALDAADEKLPLHFACDDENLSQFLHDEPTVGMHIVCFTRSEQGMQYSYYRGMHDTFHGTVDASDAATNVAVLKKSLEENLKLPLPGPLQQPYALFTPRGERLWGALDELTSTEAIADLLQSEMVIVMEGGSWTWPGVRIGFNRTIDLYSVMPGPPGTTWRADEKYRTAEIETLSLKPLVVSVKGFIEDDECDYIQEEAGPSMAYSGVSLMDKDKGRPASDWRTSQSTFLHARQDTPILYEIEQRTASLTRIPRQNQEDVQVLRYGYTEKYDAHHDFFNPELYQASPGTLQLIENGRRNRQATVFWYLSDVAKGGETVFPRFNGAPQPYDFKRCDVGLKVKPEKGKVIIFYDLLANGQMDELSLHGGCPVEEGIKWAANKWVWNSAMRYVSALE